MLLDPSEWIVPCVPGPGGRVFDLYPSELLPYKQIIPMSWSVVFLALISWIHLTRNNNNNNNVSSLYEVFYLVFSICRVS